MAQGVPINYGPCEGGPWHYKNMAHATLSYDVVVDSATKKPIPGAQKGAPGGTFVGEYRFDPLQGAVPAGGNGKWVWFDAAAIRSASKTV